MRKSLIVKLIDNCGFEKQIVIDGLAKYVEICGLDKWHKFEMDHIRGGQLIYKECEADSPHATV